MLPFLPLSEGSAPLGKRTSTIGDSPLNLPEKREGLGSVTLCNWVSNAKEGIHLWDGNRRRGVTLGMVWGVGLCGQ